MKNINKSYVILPYGVAVLCLVIGSFYDYQITDALYGQQPLLGIIFERFVLLPIEALVIVTFLMLKRVRKQPLWLLPAWIASCYVGHDGLRYVLDTKTSIGMLTVIATGILLLMLSDRLLSLFSLATLKRRLPFFLFFTCVLLTSACCTSVWKLFWGRVRYRDLVDASGFQAWYVPRGITGNTSFPSGHTTGFTVLLCFLKWRQNRYEKTPWWKPCLLYLLVILMPITRMMMGAHFLSDTAVGFMITYSWYLFYAHYFRKAGYL